mmetsp:Transcript_10650/g.26467  ORF Transcript_10650/g.26467 Transcript_10650/m.26467 type:complete len:513 (+) Transcript_10650:2-1540(+)
MDPTELNERTPEVSDSGDPCEQRNVWWQNKTHALTSGIQNKGFLRNSRVASILFPEDSATIRMKVRGQFADKVWHFLEEPESSAGALWLSRAAPFIIMMSVMWTLLQGGKLSWMGGAWVVLVEMMLDFLFTTEIMLRWFVSPSPCRFPFNFYNIIDLTAIPFLVLRVQIWLLYRFDQVPPEDRLAMTLLTVGPVCRLLKMLRRFEKFHLLLSAFATAAEALPVLLYTLGAIVLVFASAIYVVEPRIYCPEVDNCSDHIDSLPTALWLTIVTLTTVGYGDLYPRTDWGRIFVAILVIASLLYMAIPIGIVGNAFNHVWEDRDRLLLMQCTRKRLKEWGYRARDIPRFFRVFSSNGSRELNLNDFTLMIREMRIGLSDARVAELFRLFDDDESGTIEPEEFVQVLFPAAQMVFDGQEEDRRDSRDSAMVPMEGNTSMASPEVTPDSEKSSNSSGHYSFEKPEESPERQASSSTRLPALEASPSPSITSWNGFLDELDHTHQNGQSMHEAKEMRL